MRSRVALSGCVFLIFLSAFILPTRAQLQYPIGVGILGYTLECLRDYRFNLTVSYVIENRNPQSFDFIVSFSLLDQRNIRGGREKDVKYAKSDILVGGNAVVVDSFAHIVSSSFLQAKCIIGFWNAKIGAFEKSIIINRDNFVLGNGPKGFDRTEFTINWRYEMRELRYNFTYDFVFINHFSRELSLPLVEASFDFSDYGGTERVIFRRDQDGLLNVSVYGFVVKTPSLQIEIPPLSTVRLVLDVEPRRHPIVVNEGVFGYNISSLLGIRAPFVLKHRIPSSFLIHDDNFREWNASISVSTITFSRNVWEQADIPAIAFYPEKPRSMKLEETVLLSSVFPKPADLLIKIDETLVAAPIFGGSFPAMVEWPLPPESVVISVGDGITEYSRVEQNTADIDMLGREYKVEHLANSTLVKVKAIPRRSLDKLYYRTVITFRTAVHLNYVRPFEFRDGKIIYVKEDATFGYFRTFVRVIEVARFEFELPKDADTELNDCTPSGARSIETDGKRVYWEIHNHATLQDQYLLPIYVTTIANIVAVGWITLLVYVVLGLILFLVLKYTTGRDKHSLIIVAVSITSIVVAVLRMVIGVGSAGNLLSLVTYSWKAQLALLPTVIFVIVLGLAVCSVRRPPDSQKMSRAKRIQEKENRSKFHRERQRKAIKGKYLALL